MKLSKVKIENFKAIECEEIDLNSNYICFVGANGSGKSTVLSALDIFFKRPIVTADDFHNHNTPIPITITLTFTDLSAQAQQDLSDYYRQGELVVCAEIKNSTDGIVYTQYGERKVMTDFAPYFEKIEERVEELRLIYQRIRIKYTELPDIKTKTGMTSSLREFESAHPELCEYTRSNDEFYGISRGKNRLAPHIQWVHIPAVKDAASEEDEGKNTALGELLSRSVRKTIDFKTRISEIRARIAEEVKTLIDENASSLSQLSSRLDAKLKEWSNPNANLDLYWHHDEEKGVSVVEPLAKMRIGEGNYMGNISQMGHGLQRSLIVALLQELASSPDNQNLPTLLLGFEEPELYQHPPQARYMHTVLEKLSCDNSQILLTTHSPYFCSARNFNQIRRLLKSSNGKASVYHSSVADVSNRLATALRERSSNDASITAKLEQIMQPSINELFFCRVPIFVEGVEDVAFLASALLLENKVDDFRRFGCHLIVGGGKSQMSRPLTVAISLQFPTFVMFDLDIKEDDHIINERKNNLCLLRLQNESEENLENIHTSANPVFGSNYICWPPTIGDCVMNEFGDDWTTAREEVRTEYALHDGIDKKNGTLISLTLQNLKAKGKTSTLLARAVNTILEFAEQSLSD